jgi:glutaredoxin
MYPPNQEVKKMTEKVLIFGKDAWPYTRAAREAFANDDRQVDYYDVVKEARYLEIMLKHSNGTRKVPVIVEGKTVTIGFDGGTWGVWFCRLEAESTNHLIFSTEDWIFKVRHQRIPFSICWTSTWIIWEPVCCHRICHRIDSGYYRLFDDYFVNLTFLICLTKENVPDR